ncbi:MAG: amidohydrolase family protein, partial [Myxococcota bacterium]
RRRWPARLVGRLGACADAMIAGTANGAELLRVPDIGSVAEGMRADLALYDANPAEDIEALDAPRTVWKDGVVVAGRRS